LGVVDQLVRTRAAGERGGRARGGVADPRQERAAGQGGDGVGPGLAVGVGDGDAPEVALAHRRRDEHAESRRRARDHPAGGVARGVGAAITVVDGARRTVSGCTQRARVPRRACTRKRRDL